MIYTKYILIRYIYWQDWYLTVTKFEKRSVFVAMGLLELSDLRHTLVDIGTTLLCISGYNGLPGQTWPINLIHETDRRSERVDNAALSSAVSYEIPGQIMVHKKYHKLPPNWKLSLIGYFKMFIASSKLRLIPRHSVEHSRTILSRFISLQSRNTPRKIKGFVPLTNNTIRQQQQVYFKLNIAYKACARI